MTMMLGICSTIVSRTMKSQLLNERKQTNQAYQLINATIQNCPIHKHVFLFSSLHENRVQGTIDLEHGDWEIQPRAKNTDGWSDDRFAQTVTIKIPKGKRKLMKLVMT